MRHRSVALLPNRFMNLIVKLLRRFNFFFGSESTRYFCIIFFFKSIKDHHRARSILKCTINMVFYMGQKEPSNFE